MSSDLGQNSLEEACRMSKALVFHDEPKRHPNDSRINREQTTADLNRLLEHIQLNFVLVPRK